MLASNTLLAVSGGLDSMVMASLYSACGLKFGIAHLNHGLRGVQADQDEEFVKKWAETRSIPFHSKKINLKKLAESKGGNVQALGRDERYAFFESLMDEFGYELLATAHHKDDDIESIVFHALRGSGIRGLCGIPEKRNAIIRPLLRYSREELMHFAQNSSLNWREDPSNTDLKYRRNEIRHIILPALEKFNPGIKEVIYNHSLSLRESFKELMPRIQQFWKRESYQEGECLWIKKGALKDIPTAEVIVAEMLRPYGIESGLITEFLRLMSAQTGAILKTNNYEFINDRQHIIVRPLARSESKALKIENPDDLSRAISEYRAEWVNANGLDLKIGPNVLYLDDDLLNWPLLLRHPKTGDRFRPLGMKGSVLLSDFFTQLKLSRPEKERTWLLISGGEIAAVLGFRIHENFKITPHSTQALKIVQET